MFWRAKSKLTPKEMLSKAAAAAMPLSADIEERLRNPRSLKETHSSGLR